LTLSFSLGLARIAEAVGVSSVFGSEVLSTETHLLPEDQSSVMDESQTELGDIFQASQISSLIPADQRPGPKVIFYGFLNAVCPIDLANWSDLSYFWRFFEVFKVNYYFIQNLLGQLFSSFGCLNL
jgi:hypothetical protein